MFIAVDHPQLLVTLNKDERSASSLMTKKTQSGDDGDAQVRDIDSKSDGSEVSEATRADSKAQMDSFVQKETGRVLINKYC
jgi:hypothetical protein